jgi:intracellular sulfur oxidation DsrE/DsrF family protein
MKKFLLLMLLLSSALSAAADGFKVVYHLSEQHKAGMLIASVKELIKSNAVDEIKVVVHGPAIIRLSKSDQLRPEFQQLLEQGVEVGVCSQAMRKRKVKHQLIMDGVEFIEQGGVLRIIELQQQGYHYIKI